MKNINLVELISSLLDTEATITHFFSSLKWSTRANYHHILQKTKKTQINFAMWMSVNEKNEYRRRKRQRGKKAIKKWNLKCENKTEKSVPSNTKCQFRRCFIWIMNCAAAVQWEEKLWLTALSSPPLAPSLLLEGEEVKYTPPPQTNALWCPWRTPCQAF